MIKTNFGQIIASFVDSKFESTRGMECEINGEEFTGKLINKQTIYYFLDDQLVKCPWKHYKKAWMESDDQFFLSTYGMDIKNNRRNKDFACVDDNLYSGMI